MLPRLLYESLPLLYILAGLFFLVITKQPLLLFAGLLLWQRKNILSLYEKIKQRTAEHKAKKKTQRKKCVQNHLTGIRRSKYQFFRINQ